MGNTMKANELFLLFWMIGSLVAGGEAQAEVPRELQRWLTEQEWQRDTNGPIISLGNSGDFDDSHIFAPAVANADGGFLLWYCASRGSVANRIFNLGLATSEDGRKFRRHDSNPVFTFGNEENSVLTPTVLRNPNGTTLREDGMLRMWFSSTWFAGPTGLHTLHETTSADGIHWSKPSTSLLKNVYAPTIIKTGQVYQMWYTDVSSDPWVMRHASSADGHKWRVTAEPVLVVDQAWEQGRLFYPTVLKIDNVYLMWYGSYWAKRAATTSLGFAVSLDGLRWYKHPHNPVLRPDPSRQWESNYVTSQSVMQLADGSFRIWYASRTKPPFVNKYFALNTARWPGIAEPQKAKRRSVTRFKSPKQFQSWQQETRGKLRQMLGIPTERVALASEKRGELEHDGVVIEKWVFTSESGSKVPAVLYRPKVPKGPMPAIVLTFGHGGSKSQWQYNYAGLVYAKLGLACLACDPMGEEERHKQGKLGTRAHDPKSVHDRADKAGRLVMGKLVFDTMRAIDFLLERDDIAHDRIGVAGNSLGGAKAGWMAALEPRLKTAIVSGWALHDIGLRTKYCTKAPNQRMREICTWPEYAALAAPNCAVLIANGDADWVIDRDRDKTAWTGTRNAVEQAAKVFEMLGKTGHVKAWFEKDGGHRPYMVYKESLEWIHHHLGTPGWTLKQIRELPTINSGKWCDQHGIRLERLYGTELHQRGATLPDFGLHPTPREQLSCLKPGELGNADFTVEGWLKRIEVQR
jgi:cephalosporin-C deacetylase-like acetyl esterase/predicted GH43/DUF377 family glycosyl hydrolase